MNLTSIALTVVIAAWLVVLIGTVRHVRASLAGPPMAGARRATLSWIVTLTLLSGVGGALVAESRGGTRTRPVRVSDPSQQGDVVPDSLVSRGRVFYVATDKTAGGKHRCFRYEAADPPKTTPVGTPFAAAVGCQHLTKPPLSVLLVGCVDGTLWVCTDPLATVPGDFTQLKTSGSPLAVVDDIESGKYGIYALGRAGGKAVVCEVSANFANYSQLGNVEVKADAARSLLVAKHTAAVAFVYSEGTTTGIAAWRLESLMWKNILNKAEDGAAIDEATISQEVVFFTFRPKSGKTSLWAGVPAKAEDLKVDDAASLSADEDQLFLRGSSGGIPTVFTVQTAKPTTVTPLAFNGNSPDKIHDVVLEDSTAYVLADRGMTTALWMHSDKTLTVDSDWGAFDEPPRCLDASRYCCLVGESSLFVDGSDQPLLAKDAVAGYAAPRLVTQGAHILFVAKHKKGGELAVFSSYLK